MKRSRRLARLPAIRDRESGPTVEVLLSGGIDSSALLGFYLRQAFTVRALYVDFGQPAVKQELRSARAVCRYHNVPISVCSAKCHVPFSDREVPGRNAFLIFTALLVCRVRPVLISIGIHDGSPYYDCTEAFLRAVQVVVDGYDAGRVKIAAPFLKWTKPMIWQFCKKHELPVRLTYSCERGTVRPCGSCLSCKDREALSAL